MSTPIRFHIGANRSFSGTGRKRSRPSLRPLSIASISALRFIDDIANQRYSFTQPAIISSALHRPWSCLHFSLRSPAISWRSEIATTGMPRRLILSIILLRSVLVTTPPAGAAPPVFRSTR
ncbi:hypothetical protein KCP78_15250 [Salmonella enterica subsp. enterica]|nr:hypothetical protein KCP78_15250 [Salmonella enterica subsp. enterica]